MQIQDAALRCRNCKNWLLPPDVGGEPYLTAMPYPSTTTSGLAIASMVLGILWIYWIGSIVALVLGYLALREIRQNSPRFEGKGMAIAGIVLGWVGMATLFLAVVMGIYFWREDRNNHSTPERINAVIYFEKKIS